MEIPVFLPGMFWIDGHKLYGSVILELVWGSQELRLEVDGVRADMPGLGRGGFQTSQQLVGVGVDQPSVC